MHVDLVAVGESDDAVANPSVGGVDVLAGDVSFWEAELRFLHRARCRFLEAGGGSAVAALTQRIHAGRIEWQKTVKSSPAADATSDAELMEELSELLGVDLPTVRRMVG